MLRRSSLTTPGWIMGVKRRARRLVKSGYPGADDNLKIGTGAYGHQQWATSS